MMTFKSFVNVFSEQCHEIKQALTLFPYFETWETELIAECCRVSSVVEFPPDEIILGPDTGNSHVVYFILEGVCRMLQNLFVVVKKESHQKNVYKLHKHLHSTTPTLESKNENYVSKLLNQNHRFQKLAKSENYPEKANNSCDEMKRTEMRPDESNQEILSSPTEGEEVKNGKQNASGIFANRESEEEIFKKEEKSEAEPSGKTKLEPLTDSERERSQILKATATREKEESVYEVDDHLKVLEDCKKRRKDIMRAFKNAAPSEKPKNTKIFFIQTGFLLRGACFGLEKSETGNFIMSTTTVKCLKIPRRFLLQHNPCNIWSRIRLFHSLYLPTEEKIFDYFRSDRIWVERKKTQTAKIISLKNLAHYTSVSEVPYSIRLSEPR